MDGEKTQHERETGKPYDYPKLAAKIRATHLARAAVSAERCDPTYDDDLQMGATERLTDWLLARESNAAVPAAGLSDLAYQAVAEELSR